MIERDSYGNKQINPLTPEMIKVREEIDYTKPVYLEDKELVKITRLRLLGLNEGIPFLDLSYCFGELKDGTPVFVHLPRCQFSKKNLKKELIEMCKAAGRYGKGMGIFDALSAY